MSLPGWLRPTLDAARRRFPGAYWRGRNAVALAEWWLARRGLSGGDEPVDVYDHAFWDLQGAADWKGFADLILRYCPARSVVDVGCGQGTILDAMRGIDRSLDLHGYDNSPTARVRAQSRGIVVDPLDVVSLSDSEAAAIAARLRQVDLVICLEVAEHIPAWHSGKLLTILTAAPRVMFSAAHPNQGGRLHVNERPAAHWIDRFAAREFMLAPFDAAMRDELQPLALPPWYRDNVHVFERA